MSFYGNVSNASKTQLVFDRIYANRAAMDEAINKGNGTDGVFVNRLVLIEYDDNTHSRRPGYLKVRPGEDGIYKIFTDETCTIPFSYSETNRDGYGLAFGDIVYVQWPLTGEIFYFQCWGYWDTAESDAASFKKIYSSYMDSETQVTDYLLNYFVDKEAYPSDFPYNGYDSTIWKKSVQGGNEVYQMIGSLNSDDPHFSIVADAPSIDPITPHLDTNSTNTNYTLHMPTNWGFRIKEAELVDEEKEIYLSDSNVEYNVFQYNPETNQDELVTKKYPGAIYYNKEGFNPEYIRYSDKSNEISLLPTGVSGALYNKHNADNTLEARPDIQELKIQLPEIGNAIASLWDLVYGDLYLNDNNKEAKRNLDIAWGSTKGLRMVEKDPYGSGFLYSSDKANTIAGCINSVHDLMGMIVSEAPETGQSKEEALELASVGRIYYGPLGPTGQKGYFYKHPTYKYISFEDKKASDPSFNEEDYIGSRKYYDLTQFTAGKYHTYVDGSFFTEQSELPIKGTQYYKLGKPLQVNLKEWQPIDSESGLILYSYYKNEAKDYIQDESPVPTKTEYYTLEIDQATIPGPKWNETKTEIWKPIPLKNLTKAGEVVASEYLNPQVLLDYPDIEIWQGYFYMRKDEKGNNIGLAQIKASDSYDKDKEYYYLQYFAVVPNQDLDASDEMVGTPYFIKNKDIIPFSTAVNSTDYQYQSLLYAAKINILPYLNDTYYSIFAEEQIDGSIIRGYRLLKEQSAIDHQEIYYTIKATVETGYLPDEKGNILYTNYYRPAEYFFHTATEDLLLATSEHFDPNANYYRLTNKNNEVVAKDNTTGLFKIEPEDVDFYYPGEYYYRSIQFNDDILDNSYIMKTPETEDVDPNYVYNNKLVYYIPNELFVINDTAGILSKGFIWNKNIDPPETVTLGLREEIYEWVELEGFARTLNTIHGLILKINEIYAFDDELTRDSKTIQGCLNHLNDLLNSFGELNPKECIIVDDYGRLTGANLITDNWITTNIQNNYSQANFTINHNSPQAKSGNTIGLSADATPKFGATFKGFGFDIDAKGHVIANNVKNYSVTMPSLAVSDGTSGNVVTGLAIAADGQSVVANKSNIGNLAITGYASATTASALSNEDTLNSALGKLEFRTKTLEDNAAKWNAGEANVQADWNATDNTSDAYILNKPDLTEMVKTTSTFTYDGGQKTIQELMTLVATLETKVAALENPPTTG